MKETFTGIIRAAARAIAPDTMTIADLSVRAGVMNRRDHGRIRDVVRELRKTGEMVSIDRGVYSYAGRNRQKLELREVMWRILRARRNITIEDLMELAGASDRYAREWLGMLVRRGVVSHMNGRYRMIRDPVEMPSDEEKARALRDLRQRKKKGALDALDKAAAAIAEAKAIIEEDCRGDCHVAGND